MRRVESTNIIKRGKEEGRGVKAILLYYIII